MILGPIARVIIRYFPHGGPGVQKLEDEAKQGFMGNTIKFKDLSRRVTLYLDGELSKEEERELLLEIQQNPQYVQLLGKEQNFREFIKTRLQRKRVSPTLIQSIKDKIRTTG